MNVIKLDATNSTNDYLKQLLSQRYLYNYTIVTAEHQTEGRGQMGSSWETEQGKNLTFSVLVRDLLTEVKSIFYLNAAVAVSITEALAAQKIPGLAIKWPNDILAGNKKTGGILIENNIKSNGEIYSIVGIGLNVNQTDFEGLPKATSLALETGRFFDKEQLMLYISDCLMRNMKLLMHGEGNAIWEKYLQQLYKKNVPMTFEKGNQKFMGIIKDVSKSGNLRVQLDDESIQEFAVKEVQLLY